MLISRSFIANKTGKAPFGRNFNFRSSPNSVKEKIDLCKRTIQKEDMPLIVGIGDTVTSKKNNDEKSFLRGGSDRSFLEFIQILGKEFGINNKIIFVDSSSGEVERPSTKKTGLKGISDSYDKLKFDIVFKNGPKEYISWFIELAKERSNFKKNS